MRLDHAHTPELASLNRWAAVLDVDRRILRRAIERGDLDASRDREGGAFRVTRAAVEAYLRGTRFRPTAHARERLAEVQRRQEQRR